MSIVCLCGVFFRLFRRFGLQNVYISCAFILAFANFSLFLRLFCTHAHMFNHKNAARSTPFNYFLSHTKNVLQLSATIIRIECVYFSLNWWHFWVHFKETNGKKQKNTKWTEGVSIAEVWLWKLYTLLLLRLLKNVFRSCSRSVCDWMLFLLMPWFHRQ